MKRKEKGFPHHLHHFFRRNSSNFTQIWARFVACMMEFICILAIPCSENGVFLEKKNDPKRHPKTCKRLLTSSKCRNANILIIFYGGSHMFHSDPRMRSMHNYLTSGEYFSSCQDTGHWFWRGKFLRFGSTIDQTYFWSTIDYRQSTFEIFFKSRPSTIDFWIWQSTPIPACAVYA